MKETLSKSHPCEQKISDVLKHIYTHINPLCQEQSGVSLRDGLWVILNKEHFIILCPELAYVELCTKSNYLDC